MLIKLIRKLLEKPARLILSREIMKMKLDINGQYYQGWNDGLTRGREIGRIEGRAEAKNKGYIIGIEKPLIVQQAEEILKRNNQV